MAKHESLPIDTSALPFSRYTHLEWLGERRSGHRANEFGRHQLFVGREKHNPVNVLIKVTAKPGRTYEYDIENERLSLTTINERLPHSHYFPLVLDRGRLRDGRLFLITSLFDEFPLATVIGADPVPDRLVMDLRIAIEIARALEEIHALDIFHVDLNPMNVLYRTGPNRPVIRIVDFESSYERRRHLKGEFYSPPTTPGFSAPEVSTQAPDARADVYSLGAVLYAMVGGYRWTSSVDVRGRVAADDDLDAPLKAALLRAVDPTPARRFPTIAALKDALGAYLEEIWPGRDW